MWPIKPRIYYAAKRVARLLNLPENPEEDWDETTDEFTDWTLKETDLLAVLSLGTDKFYRTWEKPKRSGGTRIIRQPLRPLREIQQRLLPILYRAPASEMAHAYVPGRSILTNALPHLHSRSALCLDISNAFHHASLSDWLWGLDSFREKVSPQKQLRVDGPMTEIIIELVDYWELRGYWRTDYAHLPQGAPTSGYAFNLACNRKIDQKLLRLANNVGGQVSRYADNICFSMPGEEIDAKLRRAIWRIVDTEESGFLINAAKTQYLHHANTAARPLRLCGVNIIDGELRLRPTTIKAFRMRLYIAGKTRDRAMLNGIRGHVLHLLGHWPSQLEEVFEKGWLSTPITETEAPPGDLTDILLDD